MRVLIFSPVCQPPELLDVFLRTLHASAAGCAVWLVDDNDDPRSSDLLREFCQSHDWGYTVATPRKAAIYERDEVTHAWTTDLMLRVGQIKDTAIEKALEWGYDGLVLLDSDQVVHPKTWLHLATLNKEIVVEVLWTRWRPWTALLPNCWDVHPGLWTSPDSLIRLRTPGVYPVNGAGACTLIRRSVLEKGVRFAPVPGVLYAGEDGSFCVRAAVLEVPIYIDTHLPPYHVYRPQMMLDEAKQWHADGCSSEFFRKQLDEQWEEEIRSHFTYDVKRGGGTIKGKLTIEGGLARRDTMVPLVMSDGRAVEHPGYGGDGD